MEKDHESAGFC